MAVPGGVIGTDGRFAPDRHGGHFCPGLSRQFLADFPGKSGLSRHVPIVRAARPQGAGKAVLPHEGSGRHAAEAVLLEDVPQLYEGVVIVPVAEQHHRHRQRSPAPDLFPQERQQHIGHPPGVYRRSQHHQVRLAEIQLLLPDLGPGEVQTAAGRRQQPGKLPGNVRYRALRGSGAAEIYGPNGCHDISPLLCIFVGFID